MYVRAAFVGRQRAARRIDDRQETAGTPDSGEKEGHPFIASILPAYFGGFGHCTTTALH